MNWSESEERPNWPSELDEPVGKLGPPSAVYRNSRRKAFLKLLLGLGLTIGGVIINWLYWWVIGGPVIPDKFFLLVLFGTPVSGIVLLISSYRNRGMWVLIYGMGMLRWHRGEVLSFPWSEISELRFHRLTNCDEMQADYGPNGELTALALNLENGTARIMGSHILVQRGDGITAYFPSSLENYPQLGELIQKRTFEILWPPLWSSYGEGNAVYFGELAVTWGGLIKGEEMLPWLDFGGAKISGSKLVLSKSGKWRSWLEMQVHDVPNLHLLMALLKVGQPVVAAAAEAGEQTNVTDPHPLK